jgi:hypothetical protein
MRRTCVAVVTVVAALAAGTGAGPAAGMAAAGPGGSAAGGWVVENARADGFYDTDGGSATVVDAGGATLACSVVSGWGYADNGTVRPQDSFASSGVTLYSGCTGPGVEDVQVVSSPGLDFVAEGYDASTDLVTGVTYPLLWGLFLDAPECDVSLYPPVNDVVAPLSYDNRTATLRSGQLTVVAVQVDGTDCPGLPQVGDEVTFETTMVVSPGFTVRPA